MDTYLSLRLPDISRSRLKEAIQSGKVLVNNVQRRKPAQPLRVGDSISCSLPRPRTSAAEPEDIPIDIVHEDTSVIVVNKQAGAHHMSRLWRVILRHCQGHARVSGALLRRTCMATVGCEQADQTMSTRAALLPPEPHCVHIILS